MARKKEVLYYNGKFQGQRLSESDCRKLDNLRKVDEDGNYISEFKHLIYDLSPSEVEIIKETQSNALVDLKRGTLEPSQTVGVAYMYFAGSMILGDSVGLGKTVEICGLCNLLESVSTRDGVEFRFLYLTGKNLVNQTRDKLIRFTGNYIDSLQGVKPAVTKWVNKVRDGVEFSVVGSHSLLTNALFQDYIRSYEAETGAHPFDLLIIDESGDVLTNSSTQTYQQALFLRDSCERVILLNATAFEKELDMFYNQLSFCDPTFLPTKTEFSKEYKIMDYRGPYPTFSGKYKNADKFKELVGYRYLARTRKSVGATMTNCSADVVVVPLSVEQKLLLKKTSMPNMVYDCPSYFNMGVDTNEETTPKLAALLRVLNNEFKDEKSILIYARYKESQACIHDFLEEYGYDCRILNGDSSLDYRNTIIEQFKLGDFRVLITNVQKGLDFDNCNACIFYSYDTNPNKMVQFEGRMTRSYDIENKHVILIISRGKELKSFKNVVSDRAQASDIFAGSDFSCVLSILLNEDKLSQLE